MRCSYKNALMSSTKGGPSLHAFKALSAAPTASRSTPLWHGKPSTSSPSASPSPSSPWAKTSTITPAFPTAEIRTPLTNGHQTIPPPIYTRPPKASKKKGRFLDYARIPRVLTHGRDEPSPYGVNRYRAVILDHLAPGTTLADLTTALARTAPVGPLTSITLLPPPRHTPNGLDLGLGAHIVFGRHQATAALARAARAGTFRVRSTGGGAGNAEQQRGKGDVKDNRRDEWVVPTVSRDKTVAYHWNNARRIDSRVVLVRAPPSVGEAEVRAAMLADADALARAGPLGAECEPVVTYPPADADADGDGDGSGVVVMEWRFFSAQQAGAMRLAVERHFGERLEVYKGHDPCWVDEEQGIVPERLNREQAWRHD